MALRIAKQIAPAPPERLLKTAAAFIDAGNFERAVELLSLSEQTESAAFQLLGYALFKLGRNEAALEVASGVIRRSPFGVSGYNLLGLILHGMKEFSLAERFFRRVTLLDPVHPEASRSIVDCIRGKNQFGSFIAPARAPLLEILDEAPRGNPAELLAFGIQAYEQGLWEAARDCFFRALEQEPENPLLFRYLGMVLMDQGNLDKAMVAIAQAIRLAPRDRKSVV